MVARPQDVSSTVPTWQHRMLQMLPAIERQASLAFRGYRPEAREEAIQEVLASAACALARLAQLGKLDLAYASVLAGYGIARVRQGRYVGQRLNVNDVLSTYARRKQGHAVERIERYDASDGKWVEDIVVEDRTASPADVAIARLDVKAWLKTLSSRKRQVAFTLARGETTKATARKFDVTPGRVSQIRRELEDSWQQFQAASNGR